MKTIILNSIVTNSSSNDQGTKLFSVLQVAYLSKDTIMLEISNEMSLSSSFLNTSIGEFIDMYGVLELKKTLKIKSSSNQYERLSNYIERYIHVYSA